MPRGRQRRSTGPVACGSGSTPPGVGPLRDDPCHPPGRGRPRFCTPPGGRPQGVAAVAARGARHRTLRDPPPGGPVPQRPLVITSDTDVLDDVIRIALTAGTE